MTTEFFIEQSIHNGCVQFTLSNDIFDADQMIKIKQIMYRSQNAI